jgi:hypothetical protein
MTEEPTRTLDQAILSTWQAELKATRNLHIKQGCLEREPELLSRFSGIMSSSRLYANACAGAYKDSGSSV